MTSVSRDDAGATVRSEGITGRWKDWLGKNRAGAILCLFALLFSGAITVLHDETASPVDELVYIDYTYKTLSQGMVFEGEQFGVDVAQLVACEGVFPFGTLGQECGSGEVLPESMPNEGYTTGAPYTPVYFWITRVLGDGIQFLTGLPQVTSWRLTGSFWLAAGILVFTSLLSRWRVPQRTTLVLGALFIVSPYSWWTYTYLSTDVTAFFFGAVMLWLATEVAASRRSPWWFLPLALAAVTFKITNLLAFGLVGLFFLVDGISRALAQRRESASIRPQWRAQVNLWAALVASAIAGFGFQLLWLRLLPLLAVSDVRADQGVSLPLDLMTFAKLFTVGPGAAISHNPLGGINGAELLSVMATPLSWLSIAAVFGSLMVLRWNAQRGPIIWATALSTVLALPLLGLTFSLVTGSYFNLPGRYAASLIPAVLLLAGFMLKNRFTMTVLAAYAGALALAGVSLALFIRAYF